MTRILTDMSSDFVEGWINELQKQGYILTFFTVTPVPGAVVYHAVMEKDQ